MTSRDRLIVAEIPSLRRYAWALTGDASLADDLVQDCLERAWGRFHLWRRSGSLRAWLFTIMHNTHANTVRKEKARPVLVPLAGGDAGAVRPAQEDAPILRNLAEALAQLPLEQRTVVLLVGLEELSYAEAAKVLGIPVGTVMSRLARGRERLRRLTGGAEPAEATRRT